MPKAARRESGPSAVAPRAEPYPCIRPGDKPRGVPSSSSTPLADKSPKELNKVAEKPKANTSKPKAPKPSPFTASPAQVPHPQTAAPAAATGSFLDLKLDGEDRSSVPMHDTCSEVRRKINSLLLKDNGKAENGMPGEFKKDGTPKPWTKSALCREIGCSTRSLDTFMKAKKLMGGAESQVYPAAYIFFEKKRVFEGKKKTAGRLKVEKDMPYGLPLTDPNKLRTGADQMRTPETSSTPTATFRPVKV